MEVFVAIICASLMCLRPLFVKIMPSVFESAYGNGSKAGFTGTTSWGNGMNSKLAGKLNIRSEREELHSSDEERFVGKPHIQVETEWVIESQKAEEIELEERRH